MNTLEERIEYWISLWNNSNCIPKVILDTEMNDIVWEFGVEITKQKMLDLGYWKEDMEGYLK